MRHLRELIPRTEEQAQVLAELEYLMQASEFVKRARKALALERVVLDRIREEVTNRMKKSKDKKRDKKDPSKTETSKGGLSNEGTRNSSTLKGTDCNSEEV